MSNSPEAESEWQRKWRLEDEQRQRRSEQWVGYLSGSLRFFGVKRVEVSFDIKAGLDGPIGAPKFIPPPAGELPYGLESTIQRVCQIALPEVWAHSPGSFGKVLLDATSSGTFDVDIEWYDDEEDEEME